MTSPSECAHERLNARGRCVECNEWAVLTGQVPVSRNADDEHDISDETLASRLRDWGRD